jgi:hypothetical protein
MLGMVGPLELLGGVLAFLSRHTAAATLLSLFGTLWIVSGLGLVTAGADATSVAVGILDALVSVALLAAAIVSPSAKPFVSAVLYTAPARLCGEGGRALRSAPFAEVP